MLIRRETLADLDVIDRIHTAAFAGADSEVVEVRLVRELRADVGWVPALSLVAEDRTGSIVGHVVGTVGSVGAEPAIGVGPLGVLPPQQGNGVGSALKHAVLAAADALDYPVAVLLGHAGYYPRFGFVPAATLGITPTGPEWGEHFQARPLSAWAPSVTGLFRYAAPFERL